MEKGFTLIETVITLVIVVVLATVVFSRWNFDPIKLDAAVRKVVADVRYAQKLGVSTQRRAGVVFNATGYRLYQDLSVPLAAASPGDPCSTDGAGAFVVDFSQARCSDYSGVTIAPAVTVGFNALGKPVDAAGSALGSQAITISYRGNRTITIEAGTGRVSY